MIFRPVRPRAGAGDERNPDERRETQRIRRGLHAGASSTVPEAIARALTMAGTDFIAVPTALMKPYCQIANHVVPARAYENEIYVAYVNRCGVEGRLEYCGLSCIIGPDGSEIIRAGSQEALLIADIDKLKIEEMRKKNPVLGDRRPEVYDKLVKVFSGS